MPSSHDASPDAPGGLPDRPFVPTKHQLRYLNTWLDPTGPDTITQLAAAAKVNRRTVYDWFEDPKFCAWFTAIVDRHFAQDRLRMWKRCIQLATAGSPDHIKLVAQRCGDLRPDVQGVASDRVGGMQVFINVPRPTVHQLEPTDANTIDVQSLVLPVTTPANEQ